MSNPAVTPLTIPALVIVAFPLLILHVPPPASLNEVVNPTQTVKTPDIDEGKASTVTTAVVMQPEPRAYVIMAVPAVFPDTMPVLDPTVALVLLLIHVPPPASVKAVVDPTQTFRLPAILAGAVFTVTVVTV